MTDQGVAALLALIGLMLLASERRRRRDQVNIEDSVYAAEQQRLQTLLKYLQTSAMNQQPLGRQRETDSRDSVLWAYEPVDAGGYKTHCVHGYGEVPPGYQAAGYQNAFIDVCPECFPSQVLGFQGFVVPPAIPQYMVPQGQPVPQLSLRKAQKHERPPGPKPVAPPGFKAVRMVVEIPK